MPRSNRREIAAFVGIVVAGSIALWIGLQPRQPDFAPYKRLESRNPDYRAGGAKCDPKRLSALVGREAANERDRCTEAAEDDRLKQDDLMQQTRSANAAEAAAMVAGEQSKIAVIGLILGFITMIAAIAAAIFARKAAVETEKGVKAAEKALSHTVAATSTDLRPYVFIDRIEFSEKDGWFNVVIWLKNYGRVPARSIMVGSHVYVDDGMAPLKKDVLRKDKVSIPFCAPNHERRTFDGVWIESGARDQIDEDMLCIVLRGLIPFAYVNRVCVLC